jgi:hypothetical protein
MRSLLVALLAVVAFSTAAPEARADYTFEFSNTNGSSFQSAFSVQSGQSIAIQVYLVQNNSGMYNSLNTLGLSSAGVQLNTQNTSIANVTAVTGNSGFDSINTVTGANAKVSETVIVNNPVVSSSATPNQILLGTFTFTGYSAGSTVTVNALPGSGSDNVLGDYTTVIDNYITTTSAAITVTPAPEPGTMALTGLAGAAIVGSYYRRKRPTPAVA